MKSINQIKKEQFQLQKAVKFLIDCCLDRNGNQKIVNTKPVVAHSLRMGFDLLRRGYDSDLVIAALLHDVNEDAGVSIREIEKRFGKKVAKIVAAVSCNRNIPNDEERYLDIYKRTKNMGRRAIIVSVADHLNNADYYKYGKNKLTRKEVYEKWQIFLKTVASKISNEPIYQELKGKMKNL